MDEAAERLNMRVRTVQSLCSKRELPATKLAGKWYVLADATRRQLAAQCGVEMPMPAHEDVSASKAEAASKIREVRRLAADLLKALADLED